VKDYPTSAIRNVAFIGHGSSGKTTIAEAMLFHMKAIGRMGTVDEGTTHSDTLAEEIERKSSISASLLTAEHKGTKINLLDTPGFTDFIGEVKGVLRVCDFALTAVHGVYGIEVVTEQVWDFATEINTPRGFFINQLDKENTKFDVILDDLESTFGNTAPVHYAVNPGPGFSQIINLLTMKLLSFEGGKMSSEEIPANLQNKANELRETLIEKVAEADDELLEKFFEEGELTQDEIVSGLKKGIIAGTIYPVLCGAAAEMIGIQTLTDFITTYCPSPEDTPGETAIDAKSGEEIEVNIDANGPTALLIFKTTSEAHVGEMSYFKVFSGTLNSGDELSNSAEDTTEKLNQIYAALGKDRTAVEKVVAGDFGVLVKLHKTFTGNTLSDSKAPVTLNPPKFPEPMIRAAVISKGEGDEDKIATGLSTISKADPTFVIAYDPELSQTIISGQGEAQLNVILSRLKDRFGVEAELIKPNIPYRETIKSKAEAEGKHKKQSGGRGQFGLCWLRVEPNKRGDGYEYLDEVVGGSIPRNFIPAVDKGVRETLDKGVIAGFPVVDVKVAVFDGKYHPVDSDEFSFKIAGSVGFREAFKKCKTAILEPIYEVELKVPQECMGDVMGDISGRRGKVSTMDIEGKWQIIKATVPLAELYKYANTLRSLTSGRGGYRRKFANYEEVPHDIQQQLIEEYEAKRAEG
jgi:elongation factor G